MRTPTNRKIYQNTNGTWTIEMEDGEYDISITTLTEEELIKNPLQATDRNWIETFNGTIIKQFCGPIKRTKVRKPSYAQAFEIITQLVAACGNQTIIEKLKANQK